MTNFSFLEKGFQAIFADAIIAEKHTFTAPKYAAIMCRTALEKAVYWLYENDSDLTLPNAPILSNLLHEQCLKKSWSHACFRKSMWFD